jgi:hypothetical protein
MGYLLDEVSTSAGMIRRISTRLTARDRMGTLSVRFGFRRDHYRVDPGLYAVGDPDEGSDVLVTANYKLSFDTVRKNLDGLNVWLLVLATGGINVWCAAGKGTFGTRELVRRVMRTSLERVVKHRRLILPQLGAVGVAAHRVKESTGFTVTYGPVRASDIRAFIAARYKATKEMRRVRFRMTDRVKLIPNDFIYGTRYLLAVAVLLLILSGVAKDGFSLGQALAKSLPTIRNLVVGYVAGIVLTPLLLPFIPVRAFAFKGAIVGFLLAVALFLSGSLGATVAGAIAWFLLVTDVSSFLAMNFTGSSTYTSLSGVKKEMKFAVPVQISVAAAGVILVVIDNLI